MVIDLLFVKYEDVSQKNPNIAHNNAHPADIPDLDSCFKSQMRAVSLIDQ